jgi:hypothetical protein
VCGKKPQKLSASGFTLYLDGAKLDRYIREPLSGKGSRPDILA